MRDAITHREVKTILIQTCLNLVEAREDLVLSRQFNLPKLRAKGELEETKVPKAMLDKPAQEKSDEQKPVDFFAKSSSISSILHEQEDQQRQVEEIMPQLVSTEQKPKKVLIQEINRPQPLTYKVESGSGRFSTFNVFGCSQDYAQNATVSYTPWSHQITLKSSFSTESLQLEIPESFIPKSLEAVYSDAPSCLRIVIK